LRSKKIFILLPDGVGLRNFAFTSFVKIGEEMGWEVVFWNQTPCDLNELGYNEIKLKGKPRALTDLLKRAKINVELDHFERKYNDPVYHTYKFPPGKKGVKSKIKNFIVNQLTITYRGENGLQKLRQKLKDSERKSVFYKKCNEILQREKPDFVFCANQRPVNAIAPLTAAQDLGIQTGTFIFSWDNLPKATMVVEPDFYFVWSEHMKQELLQYYPYIKQKQVLITGSPQFEPHYDLSLRTSKEEFFKGHNLDPNKKYFCFSGDDITTSPDDPKYLRDIAEVIKNMNNENFNSVIIFRRCPTDFSNRYREVIEDYQDLIFPIAPKWKQVGGMWNHVLPTKEDFKLQVNTIHHTIAVINVGSSMVFDYAIFEKPCIYINYDVEQKLDGNWSTNKIYDFIHFRSMPSNNPVLWVKSKGDIQEKLKQALLGAPETVCEAKKWFKKINFSSTKSASQNIWNSIQDIFYQP